MNSTCAFQVKQGAFSIETASVAGQGTVGAHHAVAGHHDGQWVSPNGSSHCAHGFWAANCCSHGLVTAGFTRCNLAQCLPDDLLKCCAVAQVKRQVELRAPPGKVLRQLQCRPLQHRVVGSLFET
jgi:hypothetical protein